MDQALSNALKKQRELRLELQKIEQFISMYEAFSGTKVIRDEMVSQSSADQESQSRPTGRLRLRNVPRRIVMAAKKAIENAGHPLTRGELVERIEEFGVRIYSEDKPRYIGTLMWRNDDVFENIEGRGYWLKNRPIPNDRPSLPLDK